MAKHITPLVVNNTKERAVPWAHFFLYGDSGCLDGDTWVTYKCGFTLSTKLSSLYDLHKTRPNALLYLLSVEENTGAVFWNRIEDVYKTGVKPGFEVVTAHGRLVVSADHKFWTGSYFVPCSDLSVGSTVSTHLTKGPGDAVLSTILEINPVGDREMYDVSMADPANNFVANGFVVHNSGKTTIAATFPRPIFLVPKNESSMVTLNGRDFPYVLIVDRSSPFMPGRGDTPTESGMDAALTVLEDNFEASLKQNRPELFPYDTIVVEALTHYCDLVQDELTEGSTLPMDMPRWGKLASHLRNVHTRLRNMDLHVVFTALANVSKDTKEGGPQIPGSMAEKLPSACDVIAYIEVTDMGKDKPQKHTMHLRQRKQFFARSRFPQLPAAIENFDFHKIEHLLVNPTALPLGVPEPTDETEMGD